jgi:hypothetical protein
MLNICPSRCLINWLQWGSDNEREMVYLEVLFLSILLTLQIVVVILRTAIFNTEKSLFCPYKLFMICIALHNKQPLFSVHTKRLMFVIEARCSLWGITWFFLIYAIQMNFRLKGELLVCKWTDKCAGKKISKKKIDFLSKTHRIYYFDKQTNVQIYALFL